VQRVASQPAASNDEAEIRTWAKAVREENRAAIRADHDLGILMFDVPPPLLRLLLFVKKSSIYVQAPQNVLRAIFEHSPRNTDYGFYLLSQFLVNAFIDLDVPMLNHPSNFALHYLMACHG
jgi:hypothetical protein